MAWSDAARKAAAEARRHHAKPAADSLNDWNARQQAQWTQTNRDSVARAIRTARTLQQKVSSGQNFHGLKARLKSAKGYAKAVAKMHGLKVPKFHASKGAQ